MTCRDKDTGEIVAPGSTVRDFRGDEGTLDYATRLPMPGKSGKVVVDGREYYCGVWNLIVTED